MLEPRAIGGGALRHEFVDDEDRVLGTEGETFELIGGTEPGARQTPRRHLRTEMLLRESGQFGFTAAGAARKME